MKITMNKNCCLHSSNDNNTTRHCCNTLIPKIPLFKDLSVIHSANGGYALHANYAVTQTSKISSTATKTITY